MTVKNDNVSVTVYEKNDDIWHDCGGMDIPASTDDDAAILIAKGMVFEYAKGMVFESEWWHGSVKLCVIREDNSGPRVILDEAQE